MITAAELYQVLTAVVPLYVAMTLAYGSVKWWKIFSPDQSSGINHFVAIFAVPLLSFHFISTNNPYTMNYRFIAADTVQKLLVLLTLTGWSKLSSCSGNSLDWAMTLFSVATLPNTLVMGIPLLKAMYAGESGALMVQIVVLQCIVWYTLLLFSFEYRGARILISEQFPDHNAGDIVSFEVDSDVVSFDGKDPLQADAVVGDDGKLHVVVRKSTSSTCSRSDVLSRPSNLTNAEIYSQPRGSSFNHTDFHPTPRWSSFNHTDFHSMVNGKGGGLRNPTPRLSSFNHTELHSMVNGNSRKSSFGNVGLDEESLRMANAYPPPPPLPLHPPVPVRSGLFLPATNLKKKATGAGGGGRDLQMFVWSESRLAPEPENFTFQSKTADEPDGSNSTAEVHPKSLPGNGERENRKMPAASVMMRLILIMVWRKLIRNPNTYSSLIGLVWSLVSFRLGIEMPAIIAQSIAILSDAGLGMAMFSVGLFMALQPRMITCGNTVAAFSMAIRFLAGPAVMAVASFAVGLRGVLLRIAIVQAALPQGIVPFVFAKEYNVHPDILSTGVIFGMLVALPVTLVYYILMGL